MVDKEKELKELLIMCYDTISEYRNNALGDSTINELEKTLEKFPKPF